MQKYWQIVWRERYEELQLESLITTVTTMNEKKMEFLVKEHAEGKKKKKKWTCT